MVAETAKKGLKIVLGLLVILVGIYGIVRWWGPFLNAFKGLIGIFLVLVGLLVVFLGISD